MKGDHLMQEFGRSGTRNTGDSRMIREENMRERKTTGTLDEKTSFFLLS